MNSYKTIQGISIGEYKDKGSKFIGYAIPVNTEQQIKEEQQKIRAEHPKARHHCFAFRLGFDGTLYRANDDGEPSGTGGRPILAQIDSFGVTNVLVIVVRYFGGTLLGIPGLINAYKLSTETVITAAEIVEKTFNDVYKVQFDYLQMNEVMKLVKDQNLSVLHQNFDLNCVLTISIRKTQVDSLVQKFGKISNVKLSWLYSD